MTLNGFQSNRGASTVTRKVAATEASSELCRSSTVIHALRHWADVSPSKIAYTFSSDDDRTQGLTYDELNRRVLGLARYLRSEQLTRERVLIVMESGLDYVAGFLACLAAGATAVPLYPPTSEKTWNRLRSVVHDCQPKAMLLNDAVDAAQLAQLAQLPGCRSLIMEKLPAFPVDEDSSSLIQPGDLAFLQYTSGSTGDPKGVMATHRGIMHNEGMAASAMGNDVNTVFVTWLPLYHDMGLIGMILQSLALGARTVFMSPRSFVRHPVKWLRAISAHKRTTAGGPNFAYDLCVERVTGEDIDTLDLSSWRCAFNGAEPIKASTLERFYQKFRRAGFKKDAFFPCYGLAEATLFVAGGPRDTAPEILNVDSEAIRAGMAIPVATDADAPNAERVRACVGMTIDSRDQTVRIVDPNSWACLPDLSIGEVWIKSDSVTRGYWSKPKPTADAFHAYTTDSGEGTFLRTGDLGFVRKGELYITGRIKELIIVNGSNHYPQDIEETVQALSDDFRAHYGAAFSYDDEKLAIVQALNHGEDDVSSSLEELCARIRRAVLNAHGIAPSYVGLVAPGAILKTSSGKVQRGEMRRQLLLNKLEILHSWESHRGSDDRGSRPTATEAPATTAVEAPVVEQKLAWIRDYCAKRLDSYLIDERRTIPPHVILDFGNQGLLGMQVPKRYGGLGFSTRELLRVMELLGSKDMTLALFVGLNNVLGVRPVLRSGTVELKERYLPLLASGRELCAFALTEPGAGSNPRAIEATARARGETYRVSGTKIWSGSAAWSGLMNVFARSVDDQGSVIGVSAFAIPQASPGLRQGPEALTMGLRGMIQNTIFFDNVEVEPWQMLGEPGNGMDVAQDAMCYGRLAITSTCVGAMKLCVQMMLQYAGQRSVATGNLLENPHTRAVLTEAMHEITALTALVDDVAGRIDRGALVPPEVLALCKSISTETLWKTVDRAMQLAGGRGYIESNFIPQLFRDARVFRILEGPTETLDHFIGTSVLRGRDAVRVYLQNSLDEETLGAHYDSVVRELRGSQRMAEHATSLEDWQCLALGEYLDHLALYAAACGRDAAPSTRQWLLERLRSARGRIDGAMREYAAIEGAGALRAFGDAIDREVGRRERHAEMPNTALDALFAASPGETAKASAAQSPAEAPVTRAAAPTRAVSRAEIESFLGDWIARRIGQPITSIVPDAEFAALGMGSLDSVDLSAALSEKYALRLDSTALWNYPNIRELAAFVLARVTTRNGRTAGKSG